MVTGGHRSWVKRLGKQGKGPGWGAVMPCSSHRLLSLTLAPGSSQGYQLPFDRHDWVVDRCGTPVRYVIDFYAGNAAQAGAPAAMHLDVRPALDSTGALVDRARMAWIQVLSG